MNGVRCPVSPKFCGGFLEFTIVSGKVIEICPRCDRRRAGICRDCPSKVEGCVGKAIRCRVCKAKRRRENEHNWMNDPVNRARKNRCYRKRWHASPEFRERRRLEKAAWRARNPEKVRKQKRAYLLKQPATYLATQRKWNRDPVRAAKKRLQAVEKYYSEHPRPDPHCSVCGVKIDWTPMPRGRAGRPRLTCDGCCTPAELRRRRGEPATKTLCRKEMRASPGQLQLHSPPEHQPERQWRTA